MAALKTRMPQDVHVLLSYLDKGYGADPRPHVRLFCDVSIECILRTRKLWLLVRKINQTSVYFHEAKCRQMPLLATKAATVFFVF